MGNDLIQWTRGDRRILDDNKLQSICGKKYLFAFVLHKHFNLCAVVLTNCWLSLSSYRILTIRSGHPSSVAERPRNLKSLSAITTQSSEKTIQQQQLQLHHISSLVWSVFDICANEIVDVPWWAKIAAVLLPKSTKTSWRLMKCFWVHNRIEKGL